MKLKNHMLVALIPAVLAMFAGATAAIAGEVVVVAAKSPVGELTAEQVSQVFLAKSNSLPGASAVVPIDQGDGAAVRDSFYQRVTGKNAAQIKALRSRLAFSGEAQPPRVVASDGEVKKAVNAVPGAIGYIDKASVDASVKVVLTLD